MCNLSQYIKEKGIMQGRKEGRKQGIVVGVKKREVEEKNGYRKENETGRF